MGTIGVGTRDGFYDEEPYFIFKGRRISAEQLIALLSDLQGHNLVDHLEMRVPDPDGRWIIREEHVIPEDEDDIY